MAIKYMSDHVLDYIRKQSLEFVLPSLTVVQFVGHGIHVVSRLAKGWYVPFSHLRQIRFAVRLSF